MESKRENDAGSRGGGNHKKSMSKQGEKMEKMAVLWQHQLGIFREQVTRTQGACIYDQLVMAYPSSQRPHAPEQIYSVWYVI